VEAFEICYAGGIHIEKELNNNLAIDNKEVIRKDHTDDNYSFSSTIIEDLKVKSINICNVDRYDH
jgi:hypothetical protein